MNTRYEFKDGTAIIPARGKSEQEWQAEIRKHGDIISVSAEKSQADAIKEIGNPVVSVEMSADLWGFLEEQMREKAAHNEDNRWYEAHRAIDLTLIKAIQTAEKGAKAAV